MKKLLITLLLAVSASVFAAPKEFKNTTGRDGNGTSYSFRMIKKFGSLNGVFTPVAHNKYYTYRLVGGGLSGRGGGGGRYIKEPQSSTTELDQDVVIVGWNLANMADGDEIKLKDGQTLYRIGVVTIKSGHTLPVYSLNPKDTVDRYFPRRKK